MRLGLVAYSDFQRFPVGGGLSFLREFIQAASESSDVEIALVGWSGDSTRSGVAREVQVGAREFPFFPVGAGVPPRIVPDRTYFYANVSGWKSAMSRLGCVDVLYCHSPESVLGAVRGGGKAPIAIHLHGSRDAVGRSRFLIGRIPPVKWLYDRVVLRPALTRASAVLATISEEEHRQLRSSTRLRPGIPCVRVPGMVSARLGAVLAKSPDAVIRLVSVGRLESVKGLDLPIAAIAELLRRGLKCHLSIVGDGADRPRLERIVRDWGLADHVSFRGRLEPDRIAQCLGAADVFVSGSLQEGFSLALLEAVASGTPAVVTKVGSVSEVIVPGATGEIIAQRDPVQFANAIQRVRRYPRDCANKCHEKAMQYSSPRVTRAILDILKGIARHPANASIPTSDAVAPAVGEVV